MYKCPHCEGSFKKRGLHGHLRLRHGLDGDELDSAYTEALDEGTVEPVDETAEEAASEPNEGDEVRAVPSGGESPSKEEESEPPTSYSLPETPNGSQAGKSEARGDENERRSVPGRATSGEEGFQGNRERTDREPVSHSRAYEALEQFRRARERLRAVKEETGREVEREVPKNENALSRFSIGSSKTKTETVVQRTDAEKELLERCEQELEDARRELNRAFEHLDVERRNA